LLHGGKVSANISLSDTLDMPGNAPSAAKSVSVGAMQSALVCSNTEMN
jgi:hypothetical protein